MFQHTEFLAEIEALANSRNAEVITKAFRSASIVCPHCEFPENAGEFYSDLYHYTEVKKKIHRINRSARRDLEPWRRSWHCGGTWGSGLITECRNAEARAHRIRRDLTKNWPCEACWEKYNPTGRRKYGDVFKITPEEMDLLE